MVDSGDSACKKILIPYFLAGSGHLAVAEAIAHALRQRRPRWEVRLLEPAEEFRDHSLDRVYRRAWKRILEMPSAAKQLFFDMDEAFPALTAFINSQIMRSAVLKSIGFLAGWRPDLVMSTHWGCTHMFQRARAKLKMEMPLLYVFTELAGGYQLINCGADLYFAMSTDAVRDLADEGIPEQKLREINLVVRPQFLQVKPERGEARSRLGLPRRGFVLLFNVGGEGLGPTQRFVSAFLRTVPDGRMLVACGRNEKLYNRIRVKFPVERIIPLSYRTDIELLMAASDVLAGKCGASYSMEAIIMTTPFIVTQIGAPSERPNMNYIVENGFGWYAPTPVKFAGLLRKLIEEPGLYSSAKDSLGHVSRRNGAEDIADTIVEMLA
jgi:processive 1,2-diacylglycerol beta-glucosyltransferase